MHTYVVVDANLNVLPLFLLLPDEPGRQAAATRVDDIAAPLPPDRRMKTQVLATREAERSEFLLSPETFGAELHQGLKLDQGLFDLGHCPCVGCQLWVR
jgi:hypothetical protein